MIYLEMSIQVMLQNNWNYVKNSTVNHLNGISLQFNHAILYVYCNRFMENVAFDLPQYYPPVPLPPYATGEVQTNIFSK